MRLPRGAGRAARRADGILLEAAYPEGVLCLLCGRDPVDGLLCPLCRRGLRDCAVPEDGHAVWKYENEAGALVRILKERGVAAAALPLAEGMAEKLRGMEVPPDAVITSVPMPVRRLRERGIDHGREIARALAAETGLDARPLLRRKAKSAKTQRGLSAEDRRHNVKGAFAALPDVPETVILADDVLTTGATADECAACLTAAGCRRVIVLAACRAGDDRKDS